MDRRRLPLLLTAGARRRGSPRDRARPAAAWLLAGAWLLSAAACRPTSDDRAVANEELRTVDLGGGLVLQTYPTATPRLARDRVVLRANGAGVRLCAANAGVDPQTLIVELQNLPGDTTTHCPGDPDGACGAGVTLGAAPSGRGLQLDWQVPAGRSCSDSGAAAATVELRPAAFAQPAPVRFAVAGDLLGDLALLRHVVDAVEQRQLEFLILLGNLGDGSDPSGDLDAAAEVLADLPVPVYATLGWEDVDHGGDGTFRELFGPSDADFLLHQVHFILLDSADATLSMAQLDWLDGLLDAGRTTLVFTHTPPFDPAGLRDRGFSSPREAARLVALLRRRGVDGLFAGHLLSFRATEFGGVPTWISGASGAETGDSIGPHLLQVTVDATRIPADLTVERVSLPDPPAGP